MPAELKVMSEPLLLPGESVEDFEFTRNMIIDEVALRHDRITAPWLIDEPINARPSSSTLRRFWFRSCSPATS